MPRTSSVSSSSRLSRPEDGETLGEVESKSKDSVLNDALVPLQYPTGQGSQTATELTINPAKFRAAFAADLPAAQTALMAATQRPAAELAFSEPSGAPAWKNVPCWTVVATGDKAAGADVIRSMAKRAGCRDHRSRGLPRDHDLAAARPSPT